MLNYLFLGSTSLPLEIIDGRLVWTQLLLTKLAHSTGVVKVVENLAEGPASQPMDLTVVDLISEMAVTTGALLGLIGRSLLVIPFLFLFFFPNMHPNL